jgi:hypothetical protein
VRTSRQSQATALATGSRKQRCDVFDPAQLEVTYATSGESSSFRGWGLGVAQLAASGDGPGAQEGVTNLTVRSEDPPTIGNWYKSDLE